MPLTLFLAAALQTATSSPAPAPPAPVKKVCRSEKVTGSHIATNRRCLTQAEWDAEAEANRRFYESQRVNTRSPAG